MKWDKGIRATNQGLTDGAQWLAWPFLDLGEFMAHALGHSTACRSLWLMGTKKGPLSHTKATQ